MLSLKYIANTFKLYLTHYEISHLQTTDHWTSVTNTC